MHKLTLITLAAALAALSPSIALADDAGKAPATNATAKTATTVASAIVVKTDKRPAAPANPDRWLPRHQESAEFWDAFNLIVYPGGSSGDGS